MLTLPLRTSVFGLSLFLIGACGAQAPAGEGATVPSSEAAAPAEPAAVESAPAAPVAAAPVVVDEKVRAALDAADRDAADRELDAGRHPAELMSFLGIQPGMRVADLAAGGGYTTEVLARTVGSTGKVYGQNSKFIVEKFAEKPWSARLKKQIMANVERVDAEFESPLPSAKDLDAVVMVLFYHDTVWLNIDRPAMNKAVYAALKPGGVFVVVDHAAKAGDGVKEAGTLHRIEESLVTSEVEAAGFKLAASGDFLRNPDDAKDWNASPMQAAERRGKSDRFVLKFVKP